jgi:uncharacterized repeat protein (TIGR01451 family)
VAAGVHDDLDNDPRPMGHGYDIGADELLIALAVTKQANVDPVRDGSRLTYSIQVTNTGKADLHAIVTDTLPTHVSAGAMAGQTLTWTPIITAPGGVWTQEVVVTTAIEYAGPLTNVVQVMADEGAMGIYTKTTTAYVEYAVYLPVLVRGLRPPDFCAPQLLTRVNTGPEPFQVALDTAGRRAFVAHADGVTVIDTNSHAVITEMHSLTSTQGIAYDPDNDRIWITLRNMNQVLALDGGTYETVADLPTGDGPHSVAYNPANDLVYVTNFWDWTVSVYDAISPTHVVDLTDFAEPSHIAVNPVTNKVYVANHRPGGHVTVINGASHSTHRVNTALVDGYGVAVDTTRNLVYATAIAQGRISIIDGSTDTQLAYVDVQRGGGQRVPLRVIAVNPVAGPEGHLLLVTSSEDGGRDQLLLIPNGWPTLGTPVPMDVPSYPIEGIALDLDRQRVWVTSVDSGLVSVVEDGEPVCDIPFSTTGGLDFHIEFLNNP